MRDLKFLVVRYSFYSVNMAVAPPLISPDKLVEPESN